MFWKKKADVSRTVSHKCEVSGCGLVCTDEASLKRHMDWAHPAVQSPGREPQTRVRNGEGR